jgi:kynureninase
MSGDRALDLARWRDEFPILSRSVYMISNSLGAMPREVEASLAAYARLWADRGVRAWADRWWTLGREVADTVAPLIGAPAGSVSMHENVSTAHAVVLSTLPPPGTRDTIVCTAGDFPSMIYQFRAQRALGYRIRVVPARHDFTVDESAVVEATDERTALVAVSHVLFRSSFIVDPRPIVERAREVGARVMLDLYQAAGIIPVDVTALGADFAAGGCLKWLCGGPGNAFLYTRPDRLAEVTPRMTGWFSHPEPFGFDLDEFEPPADARRMLNGTPAIPAYYAALPGLRIVGEVGVARIRAASLVLTSALRNAVDARGFESVAPRDPSRLAGTIAVNVPEAREVAAALNARDFVVDYRPGVGIRLSPHFYNTLDEVAAIVEEIDRIVRTRDYDVGSRRSTVT